MSSKGIFNAICLHLHCLPNTSWQSYHSYQKNKNGCPSAVHPQTPCTGYVFAFIVFAIFLTLTYLLSLMFPSFNKFVRYLCQGSQKDTEYQDVLVVEYISPGIIVDKYMSLSKNKMYGVYYSIKCNTTSISVRLEIKY